MNSIWQVIAINHRTALQLINSSKQAQMTCLLFVCCLVMVACRPTEPDASSGTITPLPTIPLISIPPTATPVPPTQTPIPPLLLSPSDLLTPVVEDERSILTKLILDDLAITQADVVILEERRWRSATTLDCEREVGDDYPNGRVLGYEVLIQVGDQVYVYHTDQEAHIQQCQVFDLVDLPAQVLIRIDPLAGELAHIAHRDLAERLNLHQNRVRLMEMTLHIWEDSSLGCPRDNQTYVPMHVNGYQITFSVGSEQYAYHTDSDRVLPCFQTPPVNPN
jgi:hypothetical protein